VRGRPEYIMVSRESHIFMGSFIFTHAVLQLNEWLFLFKYDVIVQHSNITDDQISR
jgi:hypothetical protein